MAPFRLRIPRPIHEEMLARAVAARPLECCGLLAGTVAAGVGEVRAIFPLVNELHSATEFVSEPRSLFAAMKAMRADGVDVLAVYHSHPASAPVPSRLDRERNYSEAVVNLIVGFPDGEPEVRGWWLSETDAREAEWSVS
ncbi:MAG: M67 family metallopeptidase [Gemmataceae bacterium]|nr:M67 family metallopeptidase [Gemmataceae bacterium]